MTKKVLTMALATLFILLIATSLFALPHFATAQDAVKTYPFVEAVPSPVGVNQRTLINFGLLNYLMTDGDGWNVTLTIEDPDGKITTVDRMTWSTGTVGYSFVPETAGTYTLKCTFEESWYNSSYISRFGPASISQYMASSETDPYELVVTEEPAPVYPGHSMPVEYWTRPIDPQLREWWSISGSWLTKPESLYAPYNNAPETAHILWNMPIGDTMGGLIGGDSEMSYQSGDAYEGKWSGSIIISGVLYYNKYTTNFYSTVPNQEIVAVDLHTGEVLWEQELATDGRIAMGQIIKWDCLNNRGGFSYLWVSSGSDMYAFEALTGDWIFNFTDVPAGAGSIFGGPPTYFGPSGELLRYFIQDGRLLRWNSSYVVMQGRTGMEESWGSAIQGTTWNASTGYDINVSISGNLPSTNILKVFPGDRVIGGNSTIGAESGNGVTLWGISLETGSEGTLLFSNTWTAPSDWVALTSGSFSAYSAEDYVATFWAKEERVTYGFSLETGDLLWKTEPQHYADAWNQAGNIAYHKLFSTGVGGIVYCYDIETGQTLWTYDADDPYMESYLSSNWWLLTTFISDNKIYVGHQEHSTLNPMPRGAPFFALDVESGDVVWRADGLFRQTHWGGPAIIGDSIIATMDTYDQQIYAIGKGPSAMTVSTPDVAVAANTPVLIKGTIMDVSPGTESESLKLRFSNGVPVVADDCQSEWMLYVYKQFEQPTDATGVSISIDAMDPSGEYIHLGDTTSDASGRFSLEYTPSTTGKYTVYATFAGSEAYYSSFAQNEMSVMASAESTPTTSEIAMPPFEMYLSISTIAIIIAIAVVGLLLLRKRP